MLQMMVTGHYAFNAPKVKIVWTGNRGRLTYQAARMPQNHLLMNACRPDPERAVHRLSRASLYLVHIVTFVAHGAICRLASLHNRNKYLERSETYGRDAAV